MSKKPTAAAANSERQRKVQTKAEANQPKKVTLPRLRFLDER
jgi:hypothetical protein